MLDRVDLTGFEQRQRCDALGVAFEQREADVDFPQCASIISYLTWRAWPCTALETTIARKSSVPIRHRHHAEEAQPDNRMGMPTP